MYVPSALSSSVFNITETSFSNDPNKTVTFTRAFSPSSTSNVVVFSPTIITVVDRRIDVDHYFETQQNNIYKFIIIVEH